MRFSIIPVLAFAIIIAALGYIFLSESRDLVANRGAIKSQVERMPNFRIQALTGENFGSMGIMSDQVLRSAGKPTVVNFFASWCQPCIAEHPFLMEMSENADVRIFGIAWNDSADAAHAWLAKHGNPFSMIGVDDSSLAGIEWGITGIPETFFLDADGVVRFSHAGPLSRESMQLGLASITRGAAVKTSEKK